MAELEPEECRLSWRIEVRGAVEESAIRSVFEWVDGECDLNLERCGAPPVEATALKPPEVVAAPAPAPAPPPAPVARQPAPSQLAPAPPVAPPVEENTAAAKAEQGSIRVSIEKVDELMNSVGELVITQSVLSQLAAPLEGRDAHELRNAIGQLERHMRALQESIMRVRMLPISVVFNRFPRLIRDLSQRLGKKIELRLSANTPSSTRPCWRRSAIRSVHLLRNAMDHGIETPEVRLAAGKSAHGVVSPARLPQGRQRHGGSRRRRRWAQA